MRQHRLHRTKIVTPSRILLRRKSPGERNLPSTNSTSKAVAAREVIPGRTMTLGTMFDGNNFKRMNWNGEAVHFKIITSRNTAIEETTGQGDITKTGSITTKDQEGLVGSPVIIVVVGTSG